LLTLLILGILKSRLPAFPAATRTRSFAALHARISLRSNSAMAANAWKFSLPDAEPLLICANCWMRLLAESGSVPSIKANTSGNCLGRPDISAYAPHGVSGNIFVVGKYMKTECADNDCA
jgi:hypothetical protein